MPAAVPLRVAVAASGGRDSTALLHCTLRQAAGLGVEVVALHVHHGLMPAADEWLQHVQRQSKRWGAAFRQQRLAGTPAAGDSVEAWARQARYAALALMARDAGCPLVLLAHHRRDQAETWLLQALRGGGPAGLSAMPRNAERDGLAWARPWLDLPRASIDAYVRRHRLQHIDDGSNRDARYARNRLRLQVWPSLLAAFPDAEAALAGAARQAQHAAALAHEVAQHDLPALLDDGGLRTAPLLLLPPARRRNALQRWLHATLPAGVPQRLLDRLQDELPQRSSARWPVAGGDAGGELRLYRGVLRWQAGASSPSGDVEPLTLDLSREGEVALPDWQGRIRVEAALAGGTSAATLRHVIARPRSGGERFRHSAQSAARSLKRQFQSRAVPAWQRQAPLFFTADDRLLFVPGLGIDGALLAAPGDAQLGLRWLPD